jgi:HAD superfamily hydrolase (TIGR01509 family)
MTLNPTPPTRHAPNTRNTRNTRNLCYVFDLDDVLLQTSRLFAPHRHALFAKLRQADAPGTIAIYERIVRPDPELTHSLRQLGAPMFVLTNASRLHAYASMKALGIHELFVGQLDADSGMRLKPHLSAYTNMQQIVTRYFTQYNATPPQVVFFDDRLENLVQPHRMGWITIWIHPEADVSSSSHTMPSSIPYVSYRFGSIAQALHFIHMRQS